jgi:hypothetical protein
MNEIIIILQNEGDYYYLDNNSFKYFEILFQFPHSKNIFS